MQKCTAANSRGQGNPFSSSSGAWALVHGFELIAVVISRESLQSQRLGYEAPTWPAFYVNNHIQRIRDVPLNRPIG